MLLNKIPCLDKGYVAYIDSSNDSDKLKSLALEFFKRTDGAFLHELSNLTVVIKCPLFVQLHLSTYAFKVITIPPSGIEAYMPNVGEIGAPDHETNRVIADDINRTTEALLMNPKAYQHDGCDRFVSQVITPISTYTTLIVQGSYNEWKRFCYQGNAPASISAYAEAIKQIMTAEWR